MFLTKKSIHRRTFLRGMGATIALPFLDAMVPALTARALKPVPRFGFVYIANGVIQNLWTPPTTGAGFELTPTLQPFAGVRNKIMVLSGLSHLQADTFGDGTGDHPRASAVWLTGVHAYDRDRSGAASVSLATTVDQIAAAHLGKGLQRGRHHHVDRRQEEDRGDAQEQVQHDPRNRQALATGPAADGRGGRGHSAISRFSRSRRQ